jgi:hypothetical protein
MPLVIRHSFILRGLNCSCTRQQASEASQVVARTLMNRFYGGQAMQPGCDLKYTVVGSVVKYDESRHLAVLVILYTKTISPRLMLYHSRIEPD